MAGSLTSLLIRDISLQVRLAVRNYVIYFMHNYLSAAPPSSPQSLAITDTVYGINDFTVSVEWESPASDGGVGIDSYTLTGAGITAPLTVLSNEPLMATLTLSYNEMHMVSITASNCAGESTASLVTIREGESVS